MMAACSSCGTVQRSATCQLPRKVTSLPTTALRRARSACGRRWGEGDDHIARDQRGGDYRDPWGGPIRATYGQRQCIQHRCQCGIGEKGEHLTLSFSKDHAFQTQIRRSHRPCSTGSRRLASKLSVFICAYCHFHTRAGADGQPISTTHPDPERIVNRKSCNFTIATTRFKPRPKPDVCRTLSDR